MNTHTLNNSLLIIDNEADILEFFSYNLKKGGFTIFTASNGKEGIRLAKEKQPALILLDLMMPEMNGIETCRQIRKEVDLIQPIIVYLSSLSEGYRQVEGFSSCAEDCFMKSITPKELLKRVKELLER